MYSHKTYITGTGTILSGTATKPISKVEQKTFSNVPQQKKGTATKPFSWTKTKPFSHQIRKQDYSLSIYLAIYPSVPSSTILVYICQFKIFIYLSVDMFMSVILCIYIFFSLSICHLSIYKSFWPWHCGRLWVSETWMSLTHSLTFCNTCWIDQR